MDARAPAQGALPLVDPLRCGRCGRDWTGVFTRAGLDLAALQRLDPERAAAASRCWLGACQEPRP
jgi:hypothetical protein